MICSIQSPDDDRYPRAANELYVADGWINSLGSAPVFSYELRLRLEESFTPLGGSGVSMTKQQWDKWPVDANDEEYILSCVLELLGLQPA